MCVDIPRRLFNSQTENDSQCQLTEAMFPKDGGAFLLELITYIVCQSGGGRGDKECMKKLPEVARSRLSYSGSFIICITFVPFEAAVAIVFAGVVVP